MFGLGDQRRFYTWCDTVIGKVVTKGRPLCHLNMRWLATTALRVTWSRVVEDGSLSSRPSLCHFIHVPQIYHSIRERSKNYVVLATDVSGILCHMPSAQFSVHTADGGDCVHARDSPPQAASSAPLYFPVLGLYLKPRKYAQKACRWPQGVGG